MIVSVATAPEDLAACLDLRAQVFIDEQAVPPDEDLDGLDDTATHLLGRLDGRAVATLRLRRVGDVAKVERVCVARDHRGKGLGRALMLAALDHVRAWPGLGQVRLGAQIAALEFYAQLGFEAVGPDYLDAGIPHRDMVRAP